MRRSATNKVARRKPHPRLPEVDEGQIIEMLRLTPTERLEKHRAFVDLIEEVQRAAGLRPHSRQS